MALFKIPEMLYIEGIIHSHRNYTQVVASYMCSHCCQLTFATLRFARSSSEDQICLKD